jgi:hypothetical protein
LDYLVQTIPERAYSPKPSKGTQDSASINDNVLKRIASFYSDSQSNLDVIDTPYSPQQLAFHLTKHTASLFCSFLSDTNLCSFAETTAKILAILLAKVPSFDGLDDVGLLSTINDALKRAPARKTLPFQIGVAIVTVLVPLQSSQNIAPYVEAAVLPELIRQLVNLLWEYLSPSKPKYHVEAVRCLLQLQAVTASSRLIEASITALMPSSNDSTDMNSNMKAAEAGGRLGVLWTQTIYEQSLQNEKGGRPSSRRQSALATDLDGGYRAVLTRPLLLILDALAEDGTELFIFVKNWLQDLPTLSRVFEVLILHLRPLKALAPKANTLDPSARPTKTDRSGVIDDSAECLYFLRHILNILRWASDFTWMTLAEEVVPPLETIQGTTGVPVPLQVLLAQISLRALQFTGPKQLSPDRYGDQDLTFYSHLTKRLPANGQIQTQTRCTDRWTSSHGRFAIAAAPYHSVRSFLERTRPRDSVNGSS